MMGNTEVWDQTGGSNSMDLVSLCQTYRLDCKCACYQASCFHACLTLSILFSEATSGEHLHCTGPAAAVLAGLQGAEGVRGRW